MSVFSKLYIKACSEINLAISALLSGSDKKLVQSVGVGTFRLVMSAHGSEAFGSFLSRTLLNRYSAISVKNHMVSR